MINRQNFLAANNAKKRALESLFGSRMHDREKVPVFSLTILQDRYFMAGALTEENTHYSNWMQSAHTSMACDINRVNKRVGPAFRHRPLTAEVEDVEGLKRLMFAMDYAPVKLGLAAEPGDYEYSTYNYYAAGKQSPWTAHFTRPRWYEELGDCDEDRQTAYTAMAREYWQKGRLDEILRSINEGAPIGTAGFRAKRLRMLALVRSQLRRQPIDCRLLARAFRYATAPITGLGWALGEPILRVILPEPLAAAPP